jgi:hypothetical protein
MGTSSYLDEYINLVIPLCMFAGKPELSWLNFGLIYLQWNLIMSAAGIFWSLVSLNIGHHGSKIIHQGDEFKSLDFGVYQLAATSDRPFVDSNLFLTLVYFGDHITHHFFPTIDAAIIPQLKDIVIDTVLEFQEEIRKISMLEGMVEQFKQIKRTEIIKIKKPFEE